MSEVLHGGLDAYMVYTPILDKADSTCPQCLTTMRDSGHVKPMSPPLTILVCDKCMLQFWRET